MTAKNIFRILISFPPFNLMALPTSTHGNLKRVAISMPKIRIVEAIEIERIFKESGFTQDFRMERFLSENDEFVNSGLLLVELNRYAIDFANFPFLTS